MKELLLIAVGSAFVNNVVLSQFLGICPFLGVSKNVKTAGGMGGAVHLLGLGERISLFAGQEGFGFEGISVALIGASNPIGVFFSGLFYGALKYGGSKLNLIKAPSEIIKVITGTIVFFIAISHVFKILGKKKEGK